MNPILRSLARIAIAFTLTQLCMLCAFVVTTKTLGQAATNQGLSGYEGVELRKIDQKESEG